MDSPDKHNPFLNPFFFATALLSCLIRCLPENTTLALLVFLVIVVQHSSSEVREYCFPNTFNVSCAKDEVIVMNSAKYGRMKKGQCITSEYHIGCWVDVLLPVDRRCSGRHECFINIPDTGLHQIQPCPKDMLAYLEADYTCRKVHTRLPYPCNHFGEPQVLTELRGSLASIVLEELGYGGSRCPWIVSVPKGRKINFTLEDFGVAARQSDIGDQQQQQQQLQQLQQLQLQQRRYHRQLHHPEAHQRSSASCQVYATLQELDVRSTVTEVTTCAPKSRQRHVLLTESSRVEVILMSVRVRNQPLHYLIKYEAVGCSDPVIPRGSHMKRDGVQATVTCNFTSQSWHIVCQDDTWFGSIDNCSIEVPTMKSSIVLSETTEIYPLGTGLLVAVMVGLVLGVLIGVMLLTLVLSCHKRYYSKKRLREAKELSSQRVIYGTRREVSAALEGADDLESNTTYCPTFASGATGTACINGSIHGNGGSCGGTMVRGRAPLDSLDRVRYTHVCGLGAPLPTCEHLTMSPG